MQLNHIRDLARLPACLSLLLSFMTFDAFLFLIITTMNSQYHIQFTQIDSTIIFMHAG